MQSQHYARELQYWDQRGTHDYVSLSPTDRGTDFIMDWADIEQHELSGHRWWVRNDREDALRRAQSIRRLPGHIAGDVAARPCTCRARGCAATAFSGRTVSI